MRLLRSLLPAFLLAAGVVAVGLLLLSPAHPFAALSAPSSVGTPDNPQARFDHEWLRLRDPETGQIPIRIHQREAAFAATLPVRLETHTDGLRRSDAVSSWVPRGPFNVGGRTRALAIDVTNESVILAGGVSGGMWRSTNGGASWVKTTAPDQLHSVTTVAQDTRPGKAQTWYYGTGEGRGNSAGFPSAAFYASNSYYGNGLFKSTDGGQTWQPLPATQSASPALFDSFFDLVWRVALDPSNAAQDEVYAATYNFIQRSTDGGASWSQVLGTSSESAYAPYTDVAVSPTGVVYATISSGNSTSGIWRSPDGITWTRITPPQLTGISFERIVLDIAPANENIVYFLARTPNRGTNHHSLFRYQYVSGDGSGLGGTWTDLSQNLPNRGGLTGTYDSQINYNMLIEIKPDNPNVVFIGGINLWRSDDGFTSSQSTTWIGGYTRSNTSYALYPNHHPDQHALAFLPSNPSVLLSAHDGGLSRTANGMANEVTWQSLNNGYITTQFYAIAIDQETVGEDAIVGGMQDNGTWQTRSAEAGVAWTELLSGDGAFAAVDAGANSYYASWQRGVVYRLMQGGAARVDPAGATRQLFINPFTLDPNNRKRMYYAGGQHIWRNDDVTAIPLGNNQPTSTGWVRLTSASPPEQVNVSFIEVSRQPANRVLFGTAEGRLFRLDNAHQATLSTTATELTSPLFPRNAYISAITFDPQNADRVLVAFSNYEVRSIFYSEDGGATWTDVSGNLEENPDGSGDGPSVRSLAMLHTSNATVYYAATSTGLYSTLSLDGANTVWAQEGANVIGNVVVDMVAVRQADGLVAIGTHGNGVFSTKVTAVQAEPITLPENYALSVAPNPFRDEARLTLILPQAQTVRVVVFDATGREVRVLHDGFLSASASHALRFKADELAAGRYFVRATGETFSVTKSLILVR